ncbi:oxidoreductase [Prolixibacteraceae bacterium JC049]|nr:oxidoreductase [Prolixibacteraceae bacterium JC049]
MNKIKVGIASYGMSGKVFHGPSLKVLDEYEVVGVFERTKNISEELFPEAKICRTFEELIELEGIELIVVNTPDHLHYEMTLKALNAGKHVVVEKPFTRTEEEAVELIQLAKEKNLVLSVYQNRRYDGNYRTIKSILDQQLLGRMVECEIHYDRYRTFINEGSWKEEGDERVGVLFNLGSHLVDQVLQLFGKPKSITAKLAKIRDNSRVNDYMNLRLDYENMQLILKSSYLVRIPGPMYTMHGVKGSFIKYGIDPQEQQLIDGALPVGDNWGKEPEEYWGELVTEINGLDYHGKLETKSGDYTDYYRELALCLRGERENPVPAEQALETIKILNAAVESYLKRKTVDL